MASHEPTAGGGQHANTTKTEELDPTLAQDLEEQQRLAADYKPDVDGLYVGNIEQVSDLAAEFDAGDPRQTKIRKLAEDFPYIRRMKRDGSCGYRALFFGFLLNLSRGYLGLGTKEGEAKTNPIDRVGLNPRDLVEQLIQKHVQAMKSRGFDEMIFEDWVETVRQTTGTLGDDLGSTLGSPKQRLLFECVRILAEAFNDEEKNMELIQYARMATSSWLIIVNPDKVVSYN